MGALTKAQAQDLEEIRQDLGREMHRFEAILPAHVPPRRFMRTIVAALTQQPKLMQVPFDVLLSECMRAASDGLMPDGKEAALVPRYGKEFSLAYQPMIAGIRKKVRNSGEVSSWDAQAVRENDLFEYEYGLNPVLRHVPNIRKPRGDTIAVYSVAIMKDGTKSFEVMSLEDVNRIRDRSDGYKAFKSGKIKTNPWDSDYEEMAKKTVARRHAKSLPSSTDLDRLLYQGDHDTGIIDYGDISASATSGKTAARSLEHKLDALGADPETGEILDEEEGKTIEGESSSSSKPSEDDLDKAYDAGFDDGEEGKPLRQMPASYRDNDELSGAYKDGHDKGSKKAAKKEAIDR